MIHARKGNSVCPAEAPGRNGTEEKIAKGEVFTFCMIGKRRVLLLAHGILVCVS